MDFQAVGYADVLKGVLNDLRAGKIASCYLLYGEEEYLIKDALEKITNLILPAGDRTLNLFYIDGEAEDIDRLRESLLTFPLISGRKVIVLGNTRLFSSRKTLPDMVQKISDYYESNPARAAMYFMAFLSVAGLSLDDLRDDGWKKISDEDWHKAVGGEGGKNRETWLPVIIAFCISHGLDIKRYGEDADRLEDILRRGLPEGNHLIMTAEIVDKRKRLFKAISDLGEVIYFPETKGEASQKRMLMNATKDLLARRGKKLAPDAWGAIGKKTGFSLRNSISAIEKLVSYTEKKNTIEEWDVEEVIGKTKGDTVFDLTAALAERNLDKCLLTLKYLLDQGDHHLSLLAMIMREIRFFLHAKIFIDSGRIPAFRSEMDYSQFQKTVYPLIKEGMGGSRKGEGGGGLADQHPYVVYNALRNSGRFSYKALVSHLEELVDMDVALKSTMRDPKLLLENFLIKACG
ncbi:MAG: DNA polymerase III subunit delta [Syntrophales bacterium]|nr:DNA polymerase III subunit delta [Syntrophales bacterium]